MDTKRTIAMLAVIAALVMLGSVIFAVNRENILSCERVGGRTITNFGYVIGCDRS